MEGGLPALSDKSTYTLHTTQQTLHTKHYTLHSIWVA